MSANNHRNLQRQARALARAQGIPYQQALKSLQAKHERERPTQETVTVKRLWHEPIPGAGATLLMADGSLRMLLRVQARPVSKEPRLWPSTAQAFAGLCDSCEFPLQFLRTSSESIVVVGLEDGATEASLYARVARVQAQLQEALIVERLDSDDVWRLLYDLYNQPLTPTVSPIRENDSGPYVAPARNRATDGTDISRLVAPDTVEEQPDYLAIGGAGATTYVRTFFLHNTAPAIQDCWLDALYASPDTLMSLLVEPLEADKWGPHLREAAAAEKAELARDRELGVASNGNIARVRDHEQYAQAIEDGATKPYRVCLLMSVLASSKTELEGCCERAFALAPAASWRSCRYTQLPAFVLAMPALTPRVAALSLMEIGERLCECGHTLNQHRLVGDRGCNTCACSQISAREFAERLWLGVSCWHQFHSQALRCSSPWSGL